MKEKDNTPRMTTKKLDSSTSLFFSVNLARMKMFTVVAILLAASVAGAQEGVPANARLVSFSSPHGTLAGFLYVPEGNGPFPAVLWPLAGVGDPGALGKYVPLPWALIAHAANPPDSKFPFVRSWELPPVPPEFTVPLKVTLAPVVVVSAASTTAPL